MILLRIIKRLFVAYGVLQLLMQLLMRFGFTWFARAYPKQFKSMVEQTAARKNLTELQVLEALRRCGFKDPTPTPSNPLISWEDTLRRFEAAQRRRARGSAN